VGRALSPATHHYPSFTVTLYPFVCSILSGEITLHEHSAITWLPAARMQELEWADADYPIIEEYQRSLTSAP
jgi:8-oxo-dGTP diphosphatase